MTMITVTHRALMVIALLMTGSSCMTPYRGPTLVSREYDATEHEILEALTRHCLHEDIHLDSVDHSSQALSGRYEFPDTPTWGLATKALARLSETIAPSVNPYGKHPFIELSFRVSSENEGGSLLEMTSTFLTWGESNGIGGIGPFPMNSKGVWEREFLDAFETSLRSSSGLPSERPSGVTSTGTGFAVSISGLILTAYHVVDGASVITVTLSDGRQLNARIEAHSPSTDLAILHVDADDLSPLPLAAPGTAKQGDHVFTLGYPVVEILGDEPKYSEGSINALSGLADEASLLQISIPIQPGNSGGPVINDMGEVIGIVTSSAAIAYFVQQTGTIPQNVNWAVKSEYASLLPPMVDIDIIPSTPDGSIEAARHAVCLVTAHR